MENKWIIMVNWVFSIVLGVVEDGVGGVQTYIYW